jgi:hypothetical protein
LGGDDENITAVVWRASKGRVGGRGLWQVLTQLGGHSFDLYLRLDKVGAHSLWVWPSLPLKLCPWLATIHATKHKVCQSWQEEGSDWTRAVCHLPFHCHFPHPNESSGKWITTIEDIVIYCNSFRPRQQQQRYRAPKSVNVSDIWHGRI